MIDELLNGGKESRRRAGWGFRIQCGRKRKGWPCIETKRDLGDASQSSLAHAAAVAATYGCLL
jgi:hypothetical protein